MGALPASLAKLRVIALKQLAELFEAHPETVRRWVRSDPDFPKRLRPRGRWRFDARVIEAYLQHQQKGGDHV